MGFFLINKKKYRYYFLLSLSFLLVVCTQSPFIDSVVPILIDVLLLVNILIFMLELAKNKLTKSQWNYKQSILNIGIALVLSTFFVLYQKNDSEFILMEIEKKCLKEKCPNKIKLSHGITSFLIVNEKVGSCVMYYSYFSIFGMKKTLYCPRHEH